MKSGFLPSRLALFYCFVLHSDKDLKTSLSVPDAYMLNLLKCPHSQISDFLYFWSVDSSFMPDPNFPKSRSDGEDQKSFSFTCGLLSLQSRLCHSKCLIQPESLHQHFQSHGKGFLSLLSQSVRG